MPTYYLQVGSKARSHCTVELTGQLVVPLPQFDGAVAPSPLVSHASTPLATPSTGAATAAASAPITSAEREKYANIFKVHQPVNGVLDANTARNVFIKSKLSMETLSQIW